MWVNYGGRTRLVAYDPQWDDYERQRHFSIVIGVPEGNNTRLTWKDRCAQSDTAPDWLLENV
jgi:hypothetical protein